MRYTFKEDFFRQIDTEEKAYWLGFLYADGYVAVRAPWVVICHITDKEHVEKLAATLNFNGPLKHKLQKTSNGFCKSYRLELCRKRFCQDLLCISKDRKHQGFPEVPEQLWPAFLRGLFDGDGCISISNCQDRRVAYTRFHQNVTWNIIVPVALGQELKERLSAYGITSTVTPSRSPSMVYVRSGSRRNALLLAKLMYTDATVYLERKRNKFDEIQSLQRGIAGAKL